MNKYAKLDSIIKEIDNLIDNRVTSDAPSFQAWKSETSRFLIDQYGEKSYEYKEFDSFRFAPAAIPFGQSDLVFVETCRKDLEKAKAILQTYLVEICDDSEDNSNIKRDCLDNPEANLTKLFSKFHRVALQIQRRYNNRNTITITDEYDVQDLLHALMKIYFDDVRAEEWTPSYAAKSARMDFSLKEYGIVVEVKKTRPSLSDKELGEQLIIDVDRYKSHPDCNKLFCFIYDPDGRIVNPKGLINDLNNRHDGFVKIFIEPQR